MVPDYHKIKTDKPSPLRHRRQARHRPGPVWSHSATSQAMAPAAAPKCVVTNALEASDDAASALPALNPNHPTHSRHAPMKLSTRLSGFKPAPKRPW